MCMQPRLPSPGARNLLKHYMQGSARGEDRVPIRLADLCSFDYSLHTTGGSSETLRGEDSSHQLAETTNLSQGSVESSLHLILAARSFLIRGQLHGISIRKLGGGLVYSERRPSGESDLFSLKWHKVAPSFTNFFPSEKRRGQGQILEMHSTLHVVREDIFLFCLVFITEWTR